MENTNNIEFNDMTHDQVMSVIKEGLHHLKTSRVQIEHSHKNEIEKEDG